jgi:hypothetical protein
MGQDRQKYYITTPIYYVNDQPHIGHVYTTTIADVAARFMRFAGRDVFFLTGTDEHAAKVIDSATANNCTPLEWADRNAALFQEAFHKLEMSNDDFIRTTEERHTDRVTAYISRLLEKGDIYMGDYEGWYDTGQEEYVPENKAKETDYKSPINGKPLQRRVERNYFFRLSKYQEALERLFAEQPNFVQPEARRNEVLGRLREGLQDVPHLPPARGGLGHRPAQRSAAPDLRLDRRPVQLSLDDGYGRAATILARRPARDRQGDPLVPRRHLARHAHRARAAAAHADPCPQLLHPRRPEDEQEPGQLHRHGDDRPVRGDVRARRVGDTSSRRTARSGPPMPTSPIRRSSTRTTPISRTRWATAPAASRT